MLRRPWLLFVIFSTLFTSAQGGVRMSATAPAAYGARELEADLRSRLPAFEGCRRDRTRLGEPTEGALTVSVLVRPNGNVWPAVVQTNTTGNALLAGCVQSSFLSMHVASPPSAQVAFVFVVTFASRGISVGGVARVEASAPAAPRTGESPASSAPSAPERTIRANVGLGAGVELPSGNQGASPAEMRGTMRGSSARIRRCYEESLVNQPTLAGRVTIQFTIHEAGNVDPATITENTTGSDALAECVRAAVARLHFSPGPTGGSVRYRYPFVFSPDDGNSALTVSEETAQARRDHALNGSSAIRRCHVAALETTPTLHVFIAIDYTLLTSGLVENATIASSTQGATVLAECIRAAIASMRLEVGPNSGPVRYRFPLELGATLAEEQREGAAEFGSSTVSAALRRASAAIRRCYEDELRNSPSLAGKVTVQFTILESGVVEGANASENTTTSPALAACVCDAVGRMHFNPGPTGGSVQYRYPFVFTPMN